MKRFVPLLLYILIISGCSNEMFEPIEYFDTSVIETNEEIIKISTFTELTTWPEYVSEYKISPKDLIEWGKTPILNVKNLHERGYTGKGIKVAIIDGAFNVEHEEFQNKEIYYDNSTEGSNLRFHGTAVASILCGKNVGIAPDVILYYFAVKTTLESGYDNKIQALRKIKKYNEENDEPIRIVSMSIGKIDELKNYEEFIEEIKNLEKQGTIVIWVSMEQKIRAGVQYELLTDRSNYKNIERNRFYKGIVGILRLIIKDNDTILLPWADYTIAHDENINKYTYLGKSTWGNSWTIPVVAGLSALALQANDGLTKEEILENMKKSGEKIIGSTIPNPEKFMELCIGE